MVDVTSLAQRAADAVDLKRVVTLTQELVRIRSVIEPNTGGSEQGVALYIANVLREMGLAPTLEEVIPGRPNLICDWRGTNFQPEKHKTLMFEGHTDVVTEGDSRRWTYPPFDAELVNGRLYGRGAADMKAGVAAAICALDAVRRTAPDLAGRIRLGFVVDEEGMMAGIKHFIERGWAREVDGAIVCEPEENELCLFQKGAMRVTVEVAGVMAHGAMPYAGVNPITALAEVIRRVEALEGLEQSRWGEHPHLGLPWFTPTILNAPTSGEAQLNVMPERASLALDIRTLPGQDHDDLLNKLRNIAQEVSRRDSRLSVTVDLFESRPATQTPADDPLVKALERAYPLVMESAPKYGGVPGATDGTFLHLAGVPIVTVGPGDRTIPHQRDEFVEVEALMKAAKLYAASAITFLGEETVE